MRRPGARAPSSASGQVLRYRQRLRRALVADRAARAATGERPGHGDLLARAFEPRVLARSPAAAAPRAAPPSGDGRTSERAQARIAPFRFETAGSKRDFGPSPGSPREDAARRGKRTFHDASTPGTPGAHAALPRRGILGRTS